MDTVNSVVIVVGRRWVDVEEGMVVVNGKGKIQ